jgi:hypothetical protein
MGILLGRPYGLFHFVETWDVIYRCVGAGGGMSKTRHDGPWNLDETFNYPP